MDLIGEIAERIGMDRKMAEALAGAALAGIRSQVEAKVGAQEAQQLDQAIPELDTWQHTAETSLDPQANPATGDESVQAAQAAHPVPNQTPQVVPPAAPAVPDQPPGLSALLGDALKSLSGNSGSGGLLDLLSGVGASAGGASNTANLASLLRQLKLSPELAAGVAPLILRFLEERLPPPLMGKVTAAIPMLQLGLSSGLFDLIGSSLRRKA